MIPILICSLMILEVLGDQIYPVIDQFKVQLENDGWIDCQSNALIQASTCSGDDLQWLECYIVPGNGLCSRQNILTNTSETLFYSFTFYKPAFQTYNIVINDKQNSGDIQIQNDIGRATIQLQSTTSSIKINQNGAYFTGLTISKECNPNCKSCDNGFCTLCNDKYYLYNYICQSDDCDLSIIDNNFITSSTGAVQDGKYIITLKYNFKIAFCLIPKIYLTKGITDSTIQMILDHTQIQYTLNSDTPDSLQITLSMDQIQTYCEEFETTSSYVYQCYLGVALTNSKITQFMAILIGQISVERATESVTQYTQAISITDSSDGKVGPVFVVSETLNQEFNADKRELTVTQTISDPSFSNFQINYLEAYIVQDGKSYDLKFDYSIQKEVTTTFGFKCDDSNFDPKSEFEFYINSIAEPVPKQIRRRQLEVQLKREQLQVIYQVQSQNIFKSSLELNKKNNNFLEMFLTVGGIGVGVLVLIVGCTYFNNKFIKKQKNSNQTQQDNKENLKGNQKPSE